ncbi:hypothetical protein ZYGR_0H04480 [Zygosaccharomyces rouxii]|uniref:ZYRO0B14322p n=2 Tax=Zygosaccharomyces rouxii TaxID=4956 RepID=C5DS69_ZYGRC|nr:uncharacterized protein ZYRO0B14322g [Zygosaccharomyces rouxii]KAH9199841.1 hypothetical protein LQ764DRAFT_227409 [Zygosaccharomyces rouxii]GAV47602.1 hypothetical protein ZYGR_0H04480 [Zygosaccharomyces rouxii]CAR26630.1 ZYRO0B14322p [Zygosaccharomyces rouxii]
MIVFKRFIVWTILFGITTIQFLLYLPNFTCTVSTGVPLCAAQFNFSIVGTSTITKDFIDSIREFLRLISYLALDMGRVGATDPKIYNEENLVDTFDPDNVYKVNFFGYCKKSGYHRAYCVQNGDSGMDVLSILVRDVGIQLSKLSSSPANNTKVLGDSLVLTYHLSLSSLRRFLKGDRRNSNAFSKILLGAQDTGTDDDRADKFGKGVDIAYVLKVFNKILFFWQVGEFASSFVCLITVIVFGLVLMFGKRHRSLPLMLKCSSSILIIVATVTLLGNTVYFLFLKLLEPSHDYSQTPDWALLQVTIGSGFVICCARYMLQLLFLPVTFLTANHYSIRRKPKKDSDDASVDSMGKDDL